MSAPLVSPHSSNDPHPYQPSDSSDGSQVPDPGYAADPALAMMWSSAPDINGTFHEGAGQSGSGDKPNPHGALTVDMPSFAAAENSMLPPTSSLVDGYNNLRQVVLASMQKQGFYGEDAMYSYNAVGYDGSKADGPGGGNNKNNDANGVTITKGLTAPDLPVQQMAHEFDQVINPLMSRCLRQVADAVTALGFFINVVNLTGQVYCAADKASYFPPPGPTPGTT